MMTFKYPMKLSRGTVGVVNLEELNVIGPSSMLLTGLVLLTDLTCENLLL